MRESRELFVRRTRGVVYGRRKNPRAGPGGFASRLLTIDHTDSPPTTSHLPCQRQADYASADDQTVVHRSGAAHGLPRRWSSSRRRSISSTLPRNRSRPSITTTGTQVLYRWSHSGWVSMSISLGTSPYRRSSWWASSQRWQPWRV